MKISIITVCFNSEKTINDTIESVRNQNDVLVEHVLVDGASSDKTLEIVKKHNSISALVSEPDRGIYDAMNKGIALASGEVIGTLNADDFYYADDVLKEVEKVFLDSKVDACYGDLVYVDQNDVNSIVRYWESKNYEEELFKSGWMPAHPTFFVRKSVYQKFGYFDLNYKIAADFELLFRFIEKNKIKTVYIPKVLVKMRTGGTTNKSLRNIVIQNKEIVRVLQKEYSDFSLVKFIYKKVVDRAVQFIKRPRIKL